ncbi:MAG: hypothetical protein FJW13_02515 [Actinobacteria bacterium]|nr:hypothetical protein [Actinomycetota bacterium]
MVGVVPETRARARAEAASIQAWEVAPEVPQAGMDVPVVAVVAVVRLL